jgi:hypothetical protein
LSGARGPGERRRRRPARHGRLGGAWKDSVLVERLLGDAAAATDGRGGAESPG